MDSAALLMSTNSILFVCFANFCRSPALQGVLDHLAKQKGIPLYVESCGLHTGFLGRAPDERMQEAAKKRGITLNNRAKIFEASFFDQFNLIFCVNKEVLSAVKAMAHTQEEQARIALATHYSKKFKDLPIPDPYRRGPKGFKEAWEMIEDACEGILAHLPPIA